MHALWAIDYFFKNSFLKTTHLIQDVVSASLWYATMPPLPHPHPQYIFREDSLNMYFFFKPNVFF